MKTHHRLVSFCGVFSFGVSSLDLKNPNFYRSNSAIILKICHYLKALFTNQMTCVIVNKIKNEIN